MRTGGRTRRGVTRIVGSTASSMTKRASGTTG